MAHLKNLWTAAADWNHAEYVMKFRETEIREILSTFGSESCILLPSLYMFMD
jgi:hypothetical protein